MLASGEAWPTMVYRKRLPPLPDVTAVDNLTTAEIASKNYKP